MQIGMEWGKKYMEQHSNQEVLLQLHNMEYAEVERDKKNTILQHKYAVLGAFLTIASVAIGATSLGITLNHK